MHYQDPAPAMTNPDGDRRSADEGASCIYQLTEPSAPNNGRSSSEPEKTSRVFRHRQFSTLKSSEKNNKSDDFAFYGPFAHLRKTLDYTYHSNYRMERQWLQDAIIEEFLESVHLTDINGDVCTTPTEPFIVFTAGAMVSPIHNKNLQEFEEEASKMPQKMARQSMSIRLRDPAPEL
mmetsp:Transcript_4451/g.12389  ORF Transcript_4451/g.12389 Transcript_4451/m.12389 type:complete len:177 (+) Transcript_4451:58-588(+)